MLSLICILLNPLNSLFPPIPLFSETCTEESFASSAELNRTTKRKSYLPWSGHFSANSFDTPAQKNRLKNIKNLLRRTMLALPADQRSALKSLEVRPHYHVSRGLSNGEKIILNTGGVQNNEELIAVFVHEMGHVVDLGHLLGRSNFTSRSFKNGSKTMSIDDPSLAFYRLSWINEKTKKHHALSRDFVSGYAQSSAFEDFAETYLYYRVHGEKLREKMQYSSVLAKKYDFMKTHVFDDREFGINNDSTFAVRPRRGSDYDATLLSFDSQDFWRRK